MPTKAELAKISALAAEEIIWPVGAYDIITTDGSHPLAHCLTGDRSMRHSYSVLRRMARDQDPDMPPRGAEEYMNAGQADVPTASDLLQMIRICASRLDGDEYEAFIAGLADLMDEDAVGSGVQKNSTEAMDRSRSDKRSARDVDATGTPHAQNPKQNPAQDRRRQAQDAAFAVRSLNASSFQKRWGGLTGQVDVWGRR